MWICVRKLIHWSLPCKFNFRMLKFRGWPQPRNYFNSEIYDTCNCDYQVVLLFVNINFTFRNNWDYPRQRNNPRGRHTSRPPIHYFSTRSLSRCIVGNFWGRKLTRIGGNKFLQRKLSQIAYWYHQKMTCLQISQRKLSQIATEPRNSRKFSPSKFPTIRYYGYFWNWTGTWPLWSFQ